MAEAQLSWLERVWNRHKGSFSLLYMLRGYQRFQDRQPFIVVVVDIIITAIVSRHHRHLQLDLKPLSQH